MEFLVDLTTKEPTIGEETTAPMLALDNFVTPNSSNFPNSSSEGPTDVHVIYDDPPMVVRVLQATSLFIIILFSVFGNLLVLYTTYRKRSLRDMTAVFVANLAVADCLGGSINMPFAMVSSITRDWVFGEVMCKINGLTNSLFCVTSILTLAMVSIDRYFAITNPFHYREKITKITAGCMIAEVWVHAFLCAALPLFNWGEYSFFRQNSACTFNWHLDISVTLFVTITCFTLPLSVLFFTYYNIFKTARRQAKEVEKLNVANRHIMAASGQDVGARVKRESKAARTLLVVLGGFLLCWTPFFTQNIFGIIFGVEAVPGQVTAFTVWFAYMNSGCNPIIYGVLNKKYRDAFRETLGIMFHIESWKRRKPDFAFEPVPRRESKPESVKNLVNNDVALQNSNV